MSIQNSQQISDIKTMLVKGMNGEGIESIEKTATEGFIDTYTITYTDGTKTTFDVTNGNWGIWTSAVTAAVSATSVTINNDAIGTTSILEVYSQNASGTVITVNDIDVTPGTAVLTFPALAEATDFILHIVNGTASGGGGGGGGTTDYLDLNNKPQINGNTLTGNKLSGDLGIPNIFQGTIAEWNQLTTAEKKAYDHASIPDSIDGGVTFPANKVVMTGGGNVEDAIDEVAERINANTLANAGTVLTYDTEFVCPSDGYIRGLVNTGATKHITFWMKRANGTWFSLFQTVGGDEVSGINCIFVKKGMRVKYDGNSSADTNCAFIPLLSND